MKREILIGITGKEKRILEKINELNRLKIKKASLFLTRVNAKERKNIYSKLLNSKIKEFPLIHLRGDMRLKEIEFLEKNFKTKWFNIHENHFKFLKKWKKYQKQLLMELNYQYGIESNTDVKKIGGFCIDLAHFKASKERNTIEHEYVEKNKDAKFPCNHLNGYNPKIKRDMHEIKSLKNFDYLKTLPKFIFGKYICMEIENPVKDQIKFKKYLKKYLTKNFNFEFLD